MKSRHTLLQPQKRHAAAAAAADLLLQTFVCLPVLQVLRIPQCQWEKRRRFTFASRQSREARRTPGAVGRERPSGVPFQCDPSVRPPPLHRRSPPHLPVLDNSTSTGTFSRRRLATFHVRGATSRKISSPGTRQGRRAAARTTGGAEWAGGKSHKSASGS